MGRRGANILKILFKYIFILKQSQVTDGSCTFNSMQIKKYVLSAYYMPGTVLGFGDVAMGETDPCPDGADVLLESQRTLSRVVMNAREETLAGKLIDEAWGQGHGHSSVLSGASGRPS